MLEVKKMEKTASMRVNENNMAKPDMASAIPKIAAYATTGLATLMSSKTIKSWLS
jgi:hypothetical protein